MNFGIIGCSRVARKRFLPALILSKKAQIISVGSRDVEKAKEYAKEFGAKSFGSYENVLENKKVDAVYISTLPLLHEEWVLKAAKARKHIICEKPAFPDLKTARKVITACEKAGVRIFENYAFLHHPQHKLAFSLLKRIGPLKRIDARFTYPFPQKGDIRLNPELGGGVFNDSLGYPIATAMFYFKKTPEKIFCKINKNEEMRIDTSAEIVLDFGSGKITEGVVAMGEDYSSKYILNGTNGEIEVTRAFSVEPDSRAEVILRVGNKEKSFFAKPASQFNLALESFCLAVKRSKKPGIFEKDILTRAKIIERMRKIAHLNLRRKDNL